LKGCDGCRDLFVLQHIKIFIKIPLGNNDCSSMITVNEPEPDKEGNHAFVQSPKGRRIVCPLYHCPFHCRAVRLRTSAAIYAFQTRLDRPGQRGLS
jgi:hypothetical protein